MTKAPLPGEEILFYHHFFSILGIFELKSDFQNIPKYKHMTLAFCSLLDI